MTSTTLTPGPGTTLPPVSSDQRIGHRDVVLTRPAERLDLRVVRAPRERVRVRREVVSEEVTLTVTVRPEVLRVERVEQVEREDLTSDPGAPPTADEGAQSWERLLRAEEPFVQMRVVPVARAHVSLEGVTEDVLLGEDPSHQVVDVDADPRLGIRDPAAS